MRFWKTLAFIAFVITLIGCKKEYESIKLNKQSLSDNWQFRQADTDEWLPASVPGCVHIDLLNNKKIEDPFYRTNERDQQWIDKKDWEYKTTFNVDPATAKMQNHELYFEGLDTYADVYLNDSLILKADNMFREWTVAISPFVKEGENQLRIYFHSPINVGLEKLKNFGYNLPAVNDQSENGGVGEDKVSVFTRKAGYHYGWDWGPRFVTSGVWRPIHLRSWNNAKIENVYFAPKNINQDKASYSVDFEIFSDINGKATLELISETDPSINTLATVDLKKGTNKHSVELIINDPKLWWSNGLGEAYLYNIKSQLRLDDAVVDEKQTNLGVRTIEVVMEPDSLGKSFHVELNGVPVFMKGANYIPNDNFLNRVTPTVYDKVIKSAVDANMNMIRVWGGGIYEDKYFYELCDKYGLLVWQDFMFACSMYPGDDQFLNSVKHEAIDNVKRLRNHPSIALWCGNNEIDVAWQQFKENGGWGWKQRYNEEQRKTIWKAYDDIFHKVLIEVVKDYHPGVFYWPSSPMADFDKHSDFSEHSGDIHYWDVWWGQKPFSEYKSQIGRFMSEYGFQSFPEFRTVQTYTVPQDHDIFSEVMQAHQRSSIGNGTIKNYMQRDYKVPTDFQKFLYVGQLLQAEGIKVAMEAHRRKMPYCMGTLYWQINDCWPVASWSSTDYYRRWKAQHYFTAKAYKSVLVSPDIEDGQLKVYVISDLLENKNAVLQMAILSFDGKKLFEKTLPVEIKANTSGVYFADQLSNLAPSVVHNNSLFAVKVMDGEKVLSDNILYFAPPKDLVLPKVSVQPTITEENGNFVIAFQSEKLVKNLYLSVTEAEGFFSDNYFDILPGETVTVTFKPEGTPSKEEFEKQLKLMKLDEI